MPAQGRKNVHGKTGVRFKAAYTKSKYENMLRNVVTDLIRFGSVKVTDAVAVDVVKEADRLVTLAKSADRMNAKRKASAFVRNVKVSSDSPKTAMDVLFDDLAKRYASRNGGFTRKLKLENRKGDNAPVTLVTWVEE